MKITQHIRAQLKLQNATFVVLLLALMGILAYMSNRYSIAVDVSSSQRHSLTETSIQLLENIDEEINFLLFAADDDPVKRPIEELLNLYLRTKDNITFKSVDPAQNPDQARELNISKHGELIIKVNDRIEHIKHISEQSITNAINRLARPDDRWILFVDGHGERKPQGLANHDLGEWGKQLSKKGFKTRPLNLAQIPVIPENTSVIVIASPQLDYLPGEIHSIKQYIKQGGNLLWFTEPVSSGKNIFPQLDSLANYLGIDYAPGTIVDPNTKRLLNGNPMFALVTEYASHKITDNFEASTLYPIARGLKKVPGSDWQRTSLFQTLPGSWAESGPLKGQVEFNAGKDTKGPLDLALIFTRIKADAPQNSNAVNNNTNTEQRIVVIGDGDFLSNSYIGNGGNLNLGVNIVNWLSHDDRFVSVPTRSNVDINIEITKTNQIILAFTFLILLPLLLGTSGFVIWRKRRIY